MIAAWMVAATLFAALLGVAAMAAERALRTAGREGRGAWLVALAGAVGWPAFAPAVATAMNGLLPRSVPAPLAERASQAVTIVPSIPPMPRGWSAWLDVALVSAWALASLVLLVRLVRAMRVLQRVERSADRDVIDGVHVLVTPTLGPAVFGVRRARVLLPRWLLDLDAPLRGLVLEHESEHCRARDPQVTLAIAAVLVLVPWNAAVWWIARRLRLAVELDCDARVLRRVEDSERYSKLLLFIAQRQSLVRLAPMLAESNSHLSRRIAAMHAPRPGNPRLRVAALAAIAILVLGYSTRFASELTAAPTISLGRFSGAHARQDEDHVAMVIAGSATPRYPDALKTAGTGGTVLVAFVVDTMGAVVPSTIKLLSASHQLLADAVRATLPKMNFAPATLHHVKVKQAVRQPFVFNLLSTSGKASEDYGASLAKLLAGAGPSPLYTMSPIVVTGLVP